MAAVLTVVMPVLPFQAQDVQAANSYPSGDQPSEPPLPYAFSMDPQAVLAVSIDPALPTSAIVVAPQSLEDIQIGKSIATEQAEAAELQRQEDLKKQQAAQQAARQAQIKRQQEAAVAILASSGNPDVAQVIIKWAGAYGVDAGWMLRVARCESGLTPTSVNHNYWAGGGNPSGVFQFLPQTFYANAARAGISGANIWNVENQAQTAAYMFSIGQSGQWACR